MCGIAGSLYRDRRHPVDEQQLRAMSSSLRHRGPDEHGLWLGDGVGLAHRRLSIIDLADGQQPLANEDGRVRVVFNGEIYNYRQLRSELESKGHQFRSRSDTEVLVHLYEELGDQLVERLRGMFAFAIWDAQQERLLLARDRVGQKPLYYFQDAERLLFASELKALLTWPDVSREIDLEALEDYVTFGVVPGERSIFAKIRKVPAACTMWLNREGWTLRPRKYWELKFQPDESKTLHQWSAELSSKFHETVDAHRVADVPIGAFLSGGLDSSAVVGSLMRSGGDSIKTFSIGFQEEEFSELPFARQVAEQFGTSHIEELVTADAVSGLADLVHFYDEPFADSSAIPTMAVCRVARQQVKVVLSGDGGDEAFGGYSRYAHDLREARIRDLLPAWFRAGWLAQLAKHWPKADWLPRPFRLKTALTNLSLSPSSAYVNTISLCRPELRKHLLNGDVIQRLQGYVPGQEVVEAYNRNNGSTLDRMTAADVAMLLPDDFLTKVDRASMAVGLEVRPPLVDHEFLEMAATIPAGYKIHNGETKWIFKKLCEQHLPHDVIWRKKQGFEIPVNGWLRGPLRETFEDQVFSSTSRLQDLFDRKYVRSLYDSHLRGTGQHGQVLWSLLVLAQWLETLSPTVSPLASNSAPAIVVQE